MKTYEILILANSIKHGQHCVAGKCTSTGQWYRPVANKHGAELSHQQARCRNSYGVFGVKTLQRVKMHFLEHAPLMNQPENYVIDDSEWIQNYKITEQELNQYLDSPKDLWGESDRVSYESICSGAHVISQSLYLVKVDNLKLHKTQDGRRRASFLYNGIEYNLAVTDPKFDEITQENKAVNGILCVSLAGEYNGNCFKIVATIF